MKRLWIGLVAATVACGGSDSTGPTTSTSTANITLSGAQTGSVSGGTVATAFNSSQNDTGVGFQTGSSVTPQVTVAIGFSGEPTTKTYTQTSAGSQSGVTVVTGSGASTALWMATVGGSGTAQGSYTLTLTDVTTVATTSSGKAYTVHGTLDATLPAAAGTSATGTVTVHATF